MASIQDVLAHVQSTLAARSGLKQQLQAGHQALAYAQSAMARAGSLEDPDRRAQAQNEVYQMAAQAQAQIDRAQAALAQNSQALHRLRTILQTGRPNLEQALQNHADTAELLLAAQRTSGFGADKMAAALASARAGVTKYSTELNQCDGAIQAINAEIGEDDQPYKQKVLRR